MQYESDSQSDYTIKSALEIKEQFYQDNAKHRLFKTHQKFECAELIQQRIMIEELTKKTFWIVPDTNKVYFDYTIFKIYAIPTNFKMIVDSVLEMCSWCTDQYNTFEVHVNIDTFTVSAANRYKDIISMFCQECMIRDTRFSERLDGMHLYNTPNMMDHISAVLLPLIPPEVRAKLRMYGKRESGEMIIKNMQNPK
jgi:hypothetical protein